MPNNTTLIDFANPFLNVQMPTQRLRSVVNASSTLVFYWIVVLCAHPRPYLAHMKTMRAVYRSEDSCHHRSGMHSTFVDRNACQSTLFFFERVTFVSTTVPPTVDCDRDWSGRRAVAHYPGHQNAAFHARLLRLCARSISGHQLVYSVPKLVRTMKLYLYCISIRV